MDNKYGVLVLGWHEDQLMCIAPYTEGRFTDNALALTVAKGDPIAGLDVHASADAELYQETGINLNDPNVEPLILQRFNHTPDSGVIYPANSGKPTQLYLDLVIVKDISLLTSKLKGQQSSYIESARQQAAQVEDLPTFQEILTSLKKDPHITGLDTITTEEEFDNYLSNKQNAGSRKIIQTKLTAIREDLEEHGLISDLQGIKFDNKINLGRYFQEGALLMPYDKYLEKIQDFGKKPPANAREAGYIKSMLGNSDREDGQLHAVMNLVSQHAEAIDLFKPNPENEEDDDARCGMRM